VLERFTDADLAGQRDNACDQRDSERDNQYKMHSEFSMS
jgi:hypothetical protein